MRPTGPKGTGYERGLYRLTGVPEDVSEAVERKFNGSGGHHTMQHVALPFLLGRQAPFLSMNKVPLGLAWFFALVLSA